MKRWVIVLIVVGAVVVVLGLAAGIFVKKFGTMAREMSGMTFESIDVLKHMHGKGYGAEALAQRAVEAQSLDVDAVSGASGSSKAMRKAIENALRKGL